MKLIISSTVYPGIDLGGYGLDYYSTGAAYDVDEPKLLAIRDAFKDLAIHNPNIANKFSIQSSGPQTPTPPTPPRPPILPSQSEPLAADGLEPEAIEEPFVLNDDDQELIEVEVEKLLSRETIADREPLLLAAGANIDIPKEIRKIYLEAVINHPDVQKKLKDTASKVLEQL